MKRILQQLCTWTLGLALLAACGGGGGADGTPPPAADTTVRVKVLDVLGFARPGAAVEVVGAGTAAAIAGSDGTALIELAPDTDLLLRVSLAGHTEQFRPLRVARGTAAYLEARLLARAPALTLPDAGAGGTLVGRNAARLTLPPAAFVDALTGAPVAGAVQVEMTPVNTNSHEIGAFPGSMRALSGSTEGVLATYGPVEYIFTQAGRRLALAEGRSAVIEMPLHATLAVDGTPLEPGDAMPVWSLNETTGVWTQEGEGMVVASASATGLALRATVTHFSWWNPDYFANPVRVNISFALAPGVTPTVCCHVDAQTVPGFAGAGAPAGVATATLPVTGGSVVVNGGSVYIFGASGLSEQGALAGAIDLVVPEGITTIDVTIPLGIDPDAPNPVITSPAAGVTTYTRGTLTVAASVSGGEPDLVELLANGAVVGPMGGSQDSGYSIGWDTTSRSEGSYQITVRATRDETVVTSVARTVVVDRTPPVIVTRSPAPGADQVSALDAVTATFNEALDPASLLNADDPTVVLFVGAGFSGTTVPVALTLGPDARTVTVTPATPLTGGSTYTVVFEGLTDRAGNPMAQAQWSFSVPVWALTSPDLRAPDEDGNIVSSVIGRPEIALSSNGEPLVLWRQSTPDGRFTLQAARRIGALWVPLPVLAPVGLPNSFFGDQSMALDNTGQPVVAWTQTVTNTAGCNTTQPSQLFVARFNGSAWVPLGEGNLNLEPCSQPVFPRLKVDAAGRPVLVSAQGIGSRTIQALRFQGGDWTLLGTVPVQTVPTLPFPVTELRLALDGSTPYVLRSENRSGSISHFVARLDGSAFVPVGPQVATGTRDVRGALVIDPLGRPTVAVSGASQALLALRFEGGSWTTVGSALAAGTFVDQPSIVFDGNQPIVAWNDGAVGTAFVRRFDPVAADWGEALTLRTNVGTLSELRRLPSGGPIWSALTTDGFRCCLRTVTANALP